MKKLVVSSLSVLVGALVTNAYAKDQSNLNISAVLNGYYQSGESKPLSEKAKGFGLGETELAFSGAIDDAFYGKVTAIIESADGKTNYELEEAFVQTLALPYGFSMRGGRFMSDIGYLNNQHLHTDAFVDRPAVYRAFLGNHYFDDGLRVDYVAPTDIYWAMGAEAFKGQKLQATELKDEAKSVGAYTFYTKLGGDIGESSSWQLGLSYLRNQNGQHFVAEHHHEEAAAPAAHTHSAATPAAPAAPAAHTHNAAATGKNMYGADFVYKWAPEGNYKYQHLTVSGEYFRVTDTFLASDADHQSEFDKDNHGWYVSGVYQWSPKWSTGVRYGELEAYTPHENHLHQNTLDETELELAYHYSHFSTIRLQYTRQDGTDMYVPTDKNNITLQFTMILGAHSAHQF